MEADWEIEIGHAAPLIESVWSGFVDLSRAPESAKSLQEVTSLPALAPVLVRLNAPGSGFVTAKCDVWAVAEIDPFEFDADRESVAKGLACFIDLLPRVPWLGRDLSTPREWCGLLCAALRSSALSNCRADLILRSLSETDDEPRVGVTAYLAACGATEDEATRQLEKALGVFADAVVRLHSDVANGSKLQ